jgi:hypothetical protein
LSARPGVDQTTPTASRSPLPLVERSTTRPGRRRRGGRRAARPDRHSATRRRLGGLFWRAGRLHVREIGPDTGLDHDQGFLELLELLDEGVASSLRAGVTTRGGQLHVDLVQPRLQLRTVGAQLVRQAGKAVPRQSSRIPQRSRWRASPGPRRDLRLNRLLQRRQTAFGPPVSAAHRVGTPARHHRPATIDHGRIAPVSTSRGAVQRCIGKASSERGG